MILIAQVNFSYKLFIHKPSIYLDVLPVAFALFKTSKRSPTCFSLVYWYLFSFKLCLNGVELN